MNSALSRNAIPRLCLSLCDRHELPHQLTLHYLGLFHCEAQPFLRDLNMSFGHEVDTAEELKELPGRT